MFDRVRPFGCILAVVLLITLGLSHSSPAAPKADEKGKTLVIDLGQGVKMKLVRIPAGKFMMGSPVGEKGRSKETEKQKAVTIPRDFFMAETEVTQAQWQAVMGTTPWKGQQYTKSGPNYPATYVDWREAHTFLNKVMAKTGRMVRLPWQNEWEYACRAGTKTSFSFGNSDKKMGEYAWFKSNTTDAGAGYDHAVRIKKANPWGLYDMHGNAYEWCQDMTSERLCAVRGGAWHGESKYCRSASRNLLRPTSKYYGLGFRVAMDLSR